MLLPESEMCIYLSDYIHIPGVLKRFRTFFLLTDRKEFDREPVNNCLTD